MLHGFAEVSRMELLLSLVSVGLLGAVLGFGIAQLVQWLKTPAQPRPVAPRCLRAHCDDQEQLWAWMGKRDYTLITRELWQKVQDELARFRNRPTEFRTSNGKLSPEEEQALKDAMDALKGYKGKHRKGHVS